MDISAGIPNTVIYEASPELTGDVLSIHLSQKPTSNARWLLEVKVQVAQGSFTLGFITCNSPVGGDPPSRTVGFGACPGAIGWMIVATCTTAGEEADLVMQSSKCCGGSSLGVTPNTFVSNT